MQDKYRYPLGFSLLGVLVAASFIGGRLSRDKELENTLLRACQAELSAKVPQLAEIPFDQVDMSTVRIKPHDDQSCTYQFRDKAGKAYSFTPIHMPDRAQLPAAPAYIP